MIRDVEAALKVFQWARSHDMPTVLDGRNNRVVLGEFNVVRTAPRDPLADLFALADWLNARSTSAGYPRPSEPEYDVVERVKPSEAIHYAAKLGARLDKVAEALSKFDDHEGAAAAWKRAAHDPAYADL